LRLRDWLEWLRAERIAAGDGIPRPELECGAPPEALSERQQRVQALYDRLAGDVPADLEARTPEQRARWLLANLLDWHRREKKAVWWEYFRLRELPDEDLLEERAALTGLELVDRIDTPKRSVVDRYRFPPQDCEIRRGDDLHHQDQVERIAGLVAGLTADGVHWTDSRADRRRLALADILIIAPFNAQVAALAARLPGARIGTVDKFQGQEAPVVICSLATSSPEDAPHGMDFLYSLNRLNVAVSRAKTACILVASPRLFEPDCRTPAQMRLANAFCRYLEMAQSA